MKLRETGRYNDETSPPDNFCIWPRALPRCRPCRASRGRKPIRRGRCALIVAFRRRRRDRHHRAPDRSMAVGAARPAIRHREPAGRRQQYRHRGGRARARDGYTLLLVGTANAINATLYDKLNFNFIRDIAPVAGIMPRAQRHGGESIGSGQDGSRVHRLCQGQSGQDQHGVGRQRHRVPCGRRAVQDDDRRRHGARALSRWRRPRSPTCSAGRCRSCSPPLPSSIEYIRAGKLRALAVTTATRSEALPDIPTVGEFVPGYEASAWFGVGAPKDTPAEIVDKLNKEINAGLADPKMKARLADLGGTVLAGSPADFGKLIADETEKWAKVIQARQHQAGMTFAPTFHKSRSANGGNHRDCNVRHVRMSAFGQTGTLIRHGRMTESDPHPTPRADLAFVRRRLGSVSGQASCDRLL